MSNKNLNQSLQEYGFTKDEADAYLFLSSAGPCPAKLVALRLNTNRMKAYRTLKSLEEKRIIDRIIGRPVKFVAIPLNEVVDRYMNNIKSKLSKLESKENELLKTWGSLTKDILVINEEPRFRIFQGRQQVYDMLMQMSNHTADVLRIVTTPSDLNRLSYMGFDDRLRELVSKGIQVNLLTQIDERYVDDIKYYHDFIEVRHIEMSSAIRFIIIDKTESITSVSMDDSMSMTTQDDIGLWTDSKSFVTAMNIFYQSLWNNSHSSETIIESIRSGKEPQEIKIINSVSEYLSIFHRMIEEGQTTIDIMVRYLNDLPLTLIDLLRVLKRDVKIRLLTKVDLKSFQDLSQVSREVKVLHNPSETGLLLLIVDDQFTLFNISDWKVMGQAVWSNLNSYVLTMKQVFEDYWVNGMPLYDTILQLREEQNIENNIDTIASGFRMAGWHVEKYGSVSGVNNTKYSFNIICYGPDPNSRVAIVLTKKADTMGDIIRVGTYSVNIEDHFIILASLKPFTQKEKDLAAIYNISLVHGENIEELAFRLLSYAEKLKV